ALLGRLFTRRYVALTRLVFGESGRRPELAEMFRRSVPQVGAAGVMKVLEDAQHQGLIRDDVDLIAARWLFVSPVLGWLVPAVLDSGQGEPRRPSVRQVRAIVRLFVDAVGAPSTPPTPADTASP